MAAVGEGRNLILGVHGKTEGAHSHTYYENSGTAPPSSPTGGPARDLVGFAVCCLRYKVSNCNTHCLKYGADRGTTDIGVQCGFASQVCYL